LQNDVEGRNASGGTFFRDPTKLALQGERGWGIVRTIKIGFCKINLKKFLSGNEKSLVKAKKFISIMKNHS
jgi:hypothetical protein